MKFNHQLLLLVSLGTLLSGCQMITSVNQHLPFAAKSPSRAHGTPVEMICLWEAAEGNGLNNQPTRGFAGQVLFFDQNGEEPVEVHGDVEIYLFDDLGTPEEQSKPIYKYEFEKEVFESFKTETNLGIAYQLFVPYPKKNTYEVNCSIRVRVTPDSGRAIYSKMAQVMLPGTQPPARKLPVAQPVNRVEQASFEQHVTSEAPKAASLEEIEAYFGQATLPKPKPNLTAEKQRLKSALSRVVDQGQATMNQAPLDLTEAPTHPVQTLQPAQPEVHPLLSE
ncbi:hypothetical protein [Thalassoglobus polymorphus]|uniref:Lipoprotein n=1 Tax=Thalassoglobus polymorphus TaxID=2527994 RepID=A0A517QH60_9PLAN|nr:hypothetical protein [Thalassoglobus polymorphus]QDT30887.1 hypothetical protein Mal48_01150 [Thalassoglobus polymorphus]